MADFTRKRGDLLKPLRSRLEDVAGNIQDLTGVSVRLHIADLDGNLLVDEEAVAETPYEDGYVRFDWTEGADAVLPAGTYLFEWQALIGSRPLTFPNDGNLKLKVVEELG
jgi:hypothetical protein